MCTCLCVCVRVSACVSVLNPSPQQLQSKMAALQDEKDKDHQVMITTLGEKDKAIVSLGQELEAALSESAHLQVPKP